jgi:hypothetical protein
MNDTFRMQNILADLRGSKKGGTLGDNTYNFAAQGPSRVGCYESAPRMRSLGEYQQTREKRSRTRNATVYATRSRTRAAIVLQKYARRKIVLNSIQKTNVVKHAVGWNEKNHYGDMGWCWCGQSCPCCRARAGDILGACDICLKNRS